MGSVCHQHSVAAMQRWLDSLRVRVATAASVGASRPDPPTGGGGGPEARPGVSRLGTPHKSAPRVRAKLRPSIRFLVAPPPPSFRKRAGSAFQRGSSALFCQNRKEWLTLRLGSENGSNFGRSSNSPSVFPIKRTALPLIPLPYR